MKRLIILIIVVGVTRRGWSGCLDLFRSAQAGHSRQNRTVHRDSKRIIASAIVKKLAAEGVIKHEWPLKLYLKSTGAGATLEGRRV